MSYAFGIGCRSRSPGRPRAVSARLRFSKFWQTDSKSSVAQFFWRKHLPHDNLQDFRKQEAVEDALEEINLSPAHKITLMGTDDELARQIALDPGSVTHRDYFGFTPLHWAARSGNLEATHILLKHGADVNAACKTGRTILHWAVSSCSYNVCKILLDNGADTSIVDDVGNDAIRFAIAVGSTEIVELLLEVNEKLGRRSKINFKETYLMQAAGHGSAELCKAVVGYTKDINAQDNAGQSALMYAVRFNNRSTIRLLLSYGADVTQMDRAGHSLVVYVAAFGNIEAMRLLREAKLKGLSMGAESIQRYWLWFERRSSHFFGRRAPLEDEKVAFQAFLDSIIPCDTQETTPAPRTFYVPGAFDSSEDDSDAEKDSEKDDNADLETSDCDYESCDEEIERHDFDG